MTQTKSILLNLESYQQLPLPSPPLSHFPTQNPFFFLGLISCRFPFATHGIEERLALARLPVPGSLPGLTWFWKVLIGRAS